LEGIVDFGPGLVSNVKTGVVSTINNKAQSSNEASKSGKSTSLACFEFSSIRDDKQEAWHAAEQRQEGPHLEKMVARSWKRRARDHDRGVLDSPSLPDNSVKRKFISLPESEPFVHEGKIKKAKKVTKGKTNLAMVEAVDQPRQPQ